MQFWYCLVQAGAGRTASASVTHLQYFFPTFVQGFIYLFFYWLVFSTLSSPGEFWWLIAMQEGSGIYRQENPELQLGAGGCGKLPEGRFGELRGWRGSAISSKARSLCSCTMLSLGTNAALLVVKPHGQTWQTEFPAPKAGFWLDQHWPRKGLSKVWLFPSRGSAPGSALTEH